jgi:two-component system, chemotaxis family, chemotaxis protein CheY
MKILIIDDSSLSRKILTKALGEKHKIIEAEDGIVGLEKYFLEKPELVILDLTMPGIPGLEVLTQLIEYDPTAKVIIGTADIQEESKRMAERLGASGFINKPFTVENIQLEITKSLESKGK